MTDEIRPLSQDNDQGLVATGGHKRRRLPEEPEGKGLEDNEEGNNPTGTQWLTG